MLRRNKTPKAKKTAKKTEKVEKIEEKVVEVVNADEMAAAVKTTTGNDYQQYIRNLFKDKINRR